MSIEQAVIEKPREESLQQIFSLKRDLISHATSDHADA